LLTSVISSSPRARGRKPARCRERRCRRSRAGHRVTRLRLLRLLLEADTGLRIELGDAVALGIGDRIREHRRAACARSRAAAAATRSWP
jgi:hypothetical protein